MNFSSIVVRLYHILIQSDGNVNDAEVALGKRMIEAERITEFEFNYMLNSFKQKDIATITRECIADLKRSRREQQIRAIAWMCVLANSDGFMDKAEWQFIYKIYHKELNLPLDEIMEVQKELARKVQGLIAPVVASTSARVAAF
jgi:uncharacterized tellurite resistance protein B-like protein